MISIETELEILLAQTRQRVCENPDADQVIGVKTAKGNLYFVINHRVLQGDFQEENTFFQTLTQNDDTHILCFVTMWKKYTLDMCSHNFRTKLLAIHPENLNAMTLLQGLGGYHAKPLKNLLPPEQTERKETK